MVVSQGVYFSFGVFFNPVIAEFGWSRATTAGAFSLSHVLGGVLAPITGRFSDRWGPRVVLIFCGTILGLGYFLMSQISTVWQFYVFYGVIIGIGMSGAWVPLLSTIARWFVERRSLMTGIVISGAMIGGTIAPLIADLLISNYTWRTSFIILGTTIMTVVILAALFLKRNPVQKEQTLLNSDQSRSAKMESDTKSIGLKDVIHFKQFWLINIALFCLGLCIFSINIHIVPHAIDLGFSRVTAVSILSIMAGVGILGSALLGIAGDKMGNRRTIVIGFIVMSITLFWLIPASLIWELYLFAIVFGFIQGGIAALESPLVADYFGVKSLGLIYGFITFSFTGGAALGPVFAGWIFDVTNSYQVAFLIYGSIAIVGLVLIQVLGPKTTLANT
jgi:MFS family permease